MGFINSQHNESGEKGRGVDYVWLYYDKKGKSNGKSKTYFWARNATKFGFQTEYGNYYGETSIRYPNAKAGSIGIKDSYILDAVDAVDEGARMHDLAYDAVNAKGDVGFYDDWGTIEADMVAAETWKKIDAIGNGGKDPFNGQHITQEEEWAAFNGYMIFGNQISEKKNQAGHFILKQLGHKVSDGVYVGKAYSLFRDHYMVYNTNTGFWNRREGYWKNQGTSEKPVWKPIELNEVK